MYAIARTDLHMPTGKLSAQCGHAFVEALVRAPPNRRELYRKDGMGTKVVLGGTIDELLKIQYLCEINNVPTALIIDSGHILLPHFTGEPIITCLGIGPVYRHEVKFLKSLQLIE